MILLYLVKLKKSMTLRLKAALERVQRAGVTLNKEKCEFGKEKLTFLGHLVDSQRIQADPKKTKAVREMNQPENVSELRRFLGMVNQWGNSSLIWLSSHNLYVSYLKRT